MWPFCELQLASPGVDPRRRMTRPNTRVEIAAGSDERYWSYKTTTLYFISLHYQPIAKYCRRSSRCSTWQCLAAYIKHKSYVMRSAVENLSAVNHVTLSEHVRRDLAFLPLTRRNTVYYRIQSALVFADFLNEKS